MKNRYLLVPALGLVATSPANAEGEGNAAGLDQSPVQEQPLPPPAPPPAPPPMPSVPRTQSEPPPVVVPPPPIRMVPAPRSRFPSEPALVNYAEGTPKQADYPLSSWQNDEEGTVRYRVDVDADGKVTDCVILESSGYPALDAKTCEVIMERAQFRPALEDADTPIAGSDERTYTWRKAEPELPDMTVTFRYIQTAEGRATGCELVSVEGELPAQLRKEIDRQGTWGRSCPFGNNRRGTPYRDANGVPVAKEVTITFDVNVEDASPEAIEAALLSDKAREVPPIRLMPRPPVQTIPPPAPPAIPMRRIPPPAPMAPPPPPAPTLARPATPQKQARWARYFEYPRNHDFLGEEGISQVLVLVSPNGRAADCTVTMSSGYSDLDDTACKAVTRYGRFSPALDAEGNPTSGSWTNRVRWDPNVRTFLYRDLGWGFPKEASEQGAEGLVSISFDVEPDGSVSDCRITNSSGWSVLDEETCDRIERMKGSTSTNTTSRIVERTVRWKMR